MNLRAAVLALGALFIAEPAFAQDNPACVKFQEPLAYNACLARQGPPARATHGTPEVSRGGRVEHGRRRDRAYGVAVPRRGHNGRMRLEFNVEPRRH